MAGRSPWGGYEIATDQAPTVTDHDVRLAAQEQTALFYQTIRARDACRRRAAGTTTPARSSGGQQLALAVEAAEEDP